MSSAALDHIIILLPHSHLAALPTSLTSRLSICPGGRHADGLTENKLIVLPDGVYIELIAFLPHVAPHRRQQHWWGQLPDGIVDFALTSSNVRDVERLKERLSKAGCDVTYDEPRKGGRELDDGVKIEWEVTFPKVSDRAAAASDGLAQKLRRGSVPFWCHDVTERELRVPVRSEGAQSHPCGATGFKQVVLGVPRGSLQVFRSVFGAITEDDGGDQDRFRIGTPFGQDAFIVLQEIDETEARVTSIILRAEKNTTAVEEAFETGNLVRIGFVE